MTAWPEIVAGQTTHARRGAIAHAFRHRVDYVLIDPDAAAGPALFSRNRFNLAVVRDDDHGGPEDPRRGAEWARAVLEARGVRPGPGDLRLLTQPRFLNLVFNPVSFWLAFRDGALIAAIAEVNNTFGDRHSYFIAHPDLRPIRPTDRLLAEKVMHVSPFQRVAGRYEFAFDIRDDRIGIRILFADGAEGLVATLSGPRRPMTNARLLRAALARPGGGWRTLALIHWQALFLFLKRAPFRSRPPAPEGDVS